MIGSLKKNEENYPQEAIANRMKVATVYII